MKSLRRLVFVILLVAAWPSSAQVFWSVESPDGRLSWLLGTVHSEDPRLLDFPPALIEALGQARVVALELVPDAELLMRLNDAMHYAGDGRLDEVLDPELYSEVVRLLGEYGIGEPASRRMRPWAVAVTLTIPPAETGLFMDLALSFRAHGLGLEVISLETLDEQVEFMSALDEDAQIRMIRRAIAEWDRMDELLDDLIRVYLDGDLDELERHVHEYLDGLEPDLRAHFQDAGLAQRNRIMLERAMPLLDEGGLFIAVGALHLPGEQGLISLLRKQGYTLRGIY